MNDQQRHLLKQSIENVVTLELEDGTRHLAQVLFVFDEGDTPDCFYIEVEETPDGRFLPVQGSGHSVLLSDIAGVYRLES